MIPDQIYAFALNGRPVSCQAFGRGHINRTMKVTTDTGRSYILQKINTYVFRDPYRLVANISRITEYIAAHPENTGRTLHLVPTTRGRLCHRDGNGEFWRVYDFIEGFCLDLPESPADFYESALTFGSFQHLLSQFPADTLFETIPNFHNTPDRYRQLKESIKADPLGRSTDCPQEIAFALEQEERCSILQQMLDSKQLPLRVTHNDTKMNNVMLDPNTRKGLCVLDLDTVMPGLSCHDFGDSIRFGAATAAEDEQDVSKMKLDLDLFEIYTKGFLEAATSLTETEVQVLPLGAFTMTMEVGIRFLKDYLDGDLYFKPAYENHNLVRARTQLALAADMLKKWDQMDAIVTRVAKATR